MCSRPWTDALMNISTSQHQQQTLALQKRSKTKTKINKHQ